MSKIAHSIKMARHSIKMTQLSIIMARNMSKMAQKWHQFNKIDHLADNS